MSLTRRQILIGAALLCGCAADEPLAALSRAGRGVVLPPLPSASGELKRRRAQEARAGAFTSFDGWLITPSEIAVLQASK